MRPIAEPRAPTSHLRHHPPIHVIAQPFADAADVKADRRNAMDRRLKTDKAEGSGQRLGTAIRLALRSNAARAVSETHP